MKHQFVILCVVIGTILAAQNPNIVGIDQNYVNNHLFVNVVDVIDHKPVSGFILIIEREDDSTTWTCDSAGQMPFQLRANMQYNITIIKPGYDTLRTYWAQPNDTADAYVDFYMRKSNMTADEMKAAIKASRNPIIRTTGLEGGFEYVGVSRKHIAESRFDLYYIGGQHSGYWREHK